ncbi:AraC family transcriptional regulator [Paenibacillus sp. S150]|uniref:AraC family transcriptional regulator n=1 Tax=Paenibacillus sp. S150 TaxID=2749826 RepID=UPI001C5995EB|nr:helix-turn-helix domain-containing protein [Paenibacillus sp. S150]MBW4082234.1 AraC family transcriptional regulator [Paenibacillus sp. S150]
MKKNATPAKGTGLLSGWDRLSFRLLSVQAVKDNGEVQLPQQLVFSYALIVVTSGAVQLMVDQKQFEMTAASAVLCRPDQTFGTGQPVHGVELYIYYFDVYDHGEAAETSVIAVKDSPLFPEQEIHALPDMKPVLSINNEVFRMDHASLQPLSFRAQIDFQELLYQLQQHSGQRPKDANSALEHAKQYIEAHYTDPLTVEQLAQAAEFSPKYFIDLYKKKYGKSALEYAAELRLQQAKRMMAESGVRLRDVAHQVGYADEFYFSRKFKKMIGVPPAVYMKSRRRKLAAYTPALLGQLLPLNITPYAAALHPKWTEYYYRNYRADIPVHISAYRSNRDWQANLELLRQTPADLILAAGELHTEERRELELIAPVYYQPAESEDWRGQLLQLARYLGESWQAEQWLAAYDWEVSSAKEQLHRQLGGEPVVVIRMLGSRLYLHCNRGMANMLYRELELRPAYESGTELYNVPVTPAELAAVPADHLLMLIRRDSDTLGEWGRLQNDPQWLKLPAVQRHHVHLLNSDPWREDSAYAQLRMLRQTLQLFPVNRPS